MIRILFLPFATAKTGRTGDFSLLLARQVPRYGAVLLGRAPRLEARFAVLGGAKGAAPGVPARLGPPSRVASVIHGSVRGDLAVDGYIQAGSFRVRLFQVPGGEILWQRRIPWSLPSLQRSIRAMAGGVLEVLGRSRGDLSPWVCHSPYGFFSFLRAEDLALKARYEKGKGTPIRSLRAYLSSARKDPAFLPPIEGMVRLLPYLPKGEARSALREVSRLALGPEGAAWAAKGLDLVGAHSEAQLLWETSFRQDPEHPWAARAVGDRLLSQGREEEALRVWLRAGRSSRADASLLGRLGTLLWRMGRLEEAEEAFRRLAGMPGVSPDLWHSFGSFLEERYGPGRAADELARALGPGGAPESWLQVGLKLVRAGRREEASLVGRRLASRKDKDARRMGAFLLAAVRNPKVWELLQEGADKLEEGETSQALKPLRVAAREWPHLAEVQFLLGLCFLRLERYRRAVRTLRRCLALDPNYPDARNKLGIALVAEGEFQEAYEQLSMALKESPRSVGVLTHLAQACYYLGREEEGRYYLQKARTLAPDSEAVKRAVEEFFPL